MIVFLASFIDESIKAAQNIFNGKFKTVEDLKFSLESNFELGESIALEEYCSRKSF